MRSITSNLFRGAAGLILAGVAVFVPLPAAAQQEGDEPTWTVNFNQADIGELIRFVAEATGRTIVVDPGVQGTVQVISSQAVGQEELYQLFLSILEVQGYAAVEVNDVVRVVPAQNARSQALPLNLDQPAPQSSEQLTQVIQVNNISAVQLVPILRPLAAPQAVLAAYAGSNSIIITDSAANIERIRAMVAFIDESALQQTEVVPLQNADAEEMVGMLQELEAGPDTEAPLRRLVADPRTNSILISGDELQRQGLRGLVAQLDTPPAPSGNVNVVYLQYARAVELAPILSGLLQNMRQAGGGEGEAGGAGPSVEADQATNALIITADEEELEALRAVIARLDIRRAQVLVEAVIVELSGDRGQDLGVQWLFLDDDGAYGSSSTGSPLAGEVVGAALGAGEDGDIRGPLAEALANTPGQVLGIGRVGEDLSFNVLVNALQATSAANILSTPSVLTLDNAEAVITVGRNIPFITGSYTATGNAGSNPDNPFQTIERQNVGVTLSVIPHINEGDSLVLELSQEVSSLLGADSALLNGNPITNERRIETTVLADSGETIVLGGLIEDSLRESNQKVPLLGDIPGLGRLFRNNSSVLGKTHLVIFLRATVLREDRLLEQATAEKYRFIREQQLEEIRQGVDFIDEDDLPLLPAWEELLEQLEAERAAQAGEDAREEPEDAGGEDAAGEDADG